MEIIKYKGWFINYYPHKDECDIILPNGVLWKTCKSIHSGKIIISKAVKWVKVKKG